MRIPAERRGRETPVEEPVDGKLLIGNSILGGEDRTAQISLLLHYCISSFVYAAALPAGSELGPSPHGLGWLPGRAQMAEEELFEGGSSVYDLGWVNVSNRYLGLRFSVNGEMHYGWARLTVKFRKSLPPSWEAHLTGYAYESTPDKAIEAGQTTEDVAGARELSPLQSPGTSPVTSLGALALGAAAVALHRP